MSGRISVTRWAEAEDATEWHRSQVQIFLYRDDDAIKNEKRSGIHVIRDLTASPQTVWQREADHAGYEEAHAEAERQVRLYRIRLIATEYESPAALAEDAPAFDHQQKGR